MPKIDIETLKFILQRNEPDIRKIAGIMQEIELELKAEEEEKALRPPPVKKQNVMLSLTPMASLKEKDIVGWIAQIPEEDDLATTAGRIHSAAHEFNTTPKGIRMPVETDRRSLRSRSLQNSSKSKISGSNPRPRYSIFRSRIRSRPTTQE